MSTWRVRNKTRDTCIYIPAARTRHSAMECFFNTFLAHMTGANTWWKETDDYAFARVTDDSDICKLNYHPEYNATRAKRSGLCVEIDGQWYAFCSKKAADRFVERKMMKARA